MNKRKRSSPTGFIENIENLANDEPGMESRRPPSSYMFGQAMVLKHLLPVWLLNIPCVLYDYILDFVGTGCTPRSVIDERLILMEKYLEIYHYPEAISGISEEKAVNVEDGLYDKMLDLMESDPTLANDSDEFFVGLHLSIKNPYHRGTYALPTSGTMNHYGLTVWSFKDVANHELELDEYVEKSPMTRITYNPDKGVYDPLHGELNLQYLLHDNKFIDDDDDDDIDNLE